MLDEQDPDAPVVGHTDEQLTEGGRLAPVEAGGGLIEQEDQGIPREHASQLHQSALSGRDFAGGPVGDVLEAGFLQQRVRGGANGGADRASSADNSEFG